MLRASPQPAAGPGAIPAEVTLVAVSKTVHADALRDAVAAGLTSSARTASRRGPPRSPEVPGARWHLVGPLQSNKARRALEVFDGIQSVDSVEPRRAAGSPGPRDPRGRAGRYPVLLQVNVDDDPAKAGFQPDAAAAMRSSASSRSTPSRCAGS